VPTFAAIPRAAHGHGHLAVVGLLVLASLATGCNRRFYRMWADDEAYTIIGRGATDPRWAITDYTIIPATGSRMYDPTNPDRPPMPPDDPISHKLMHCVDHKPGYPFWHRYGDLTTIDNGLWEDCLPWNDEGEVQLDLNEAIQVGRLNSRDYQSSLEQLYLSALDVTFERFRFDAQFFGGNDTFFTAAGRDHGNFGDGGGPGAQSRSTLVNNSNLGFNKLFPAGGQLMVELANNLTWQLAGPDSFSPRTILDFSLVQPLLRGGGRRVVLERLTLSERTLLANVRAMERYRQAFYVDLATGRGSGGVGPSRRGGVFGGAGLEGFTGTGGGFGTLGGGGGGGAGFSGGGTGAAQAGGFLGILQDVRNIENQRITVEELRRSHDRLYELSQADRLDKLQVDQAAQALANATSQLLTAETALQSTLDGFKIQLGLPPTLPIEIKDPALDQFLLIDPAMQEFENEVERLVPDLMPAPNNGGDPESYRAALERASDILGRITDLLADVKDTLLPTVEKSYKKLEGSAKERERNIDHLKEVARRRNVVDDAAARRALLKEHLDLIRDDLQKLRIAFAEPDEQIPPPAFPTPGDLEAAEAWKDWLDNAPISAVVEGMHEYLERASGLADEPNWLDQPYLPGVTAAEGVSMLFDSVWQLAERLKSQAPELWLTNARAQLETIVLQPNDLDPDRALEIAAYNRLDWMNARASLVDQWRLIEFNANSLLSVLDLSVSGDIGSTDNTPFRFRDTNGSLTVGVQWDAPLTRLSERNLYRQTLIEYQQSRRSYMAYVDGISRQLRNTLRTMDLNLLNFELRRQAVWIAIDQVAQAEVRLIEPPQPGADATQGTLGPTTARDVVSALSDFLSTQNDYLSVWVNYYVLRMQLDFDLGTMQIDPRGIWVDPGTVGAVTIPSDVCHVWMPPDLAGVRPYPTPGDTQDPAEELPPGVEVPAGGPDAGDPSAVPFEDIDRIPGVPQSEEPPIGPEDQLQELPPPGSGAEPEEEAGSRPEIGPDEAIEAEEIVAPGPLIEAAGSTFGPPPLPGEQMKDEAAEATVQRIEVIVEEDDADGEATVRALPTMWKKKR
jgi:outer membrane protein TolC